MIEKIYCDNTDDCLKIKPNKPNEKEILTKTNSYESLELKKIFNSKYQMME